MDWKLTMHIKNNKSKSAVVEHERNFNVYYNSDFDILCSENKQDKWGND